MSLKRCFVWSAATWILVGSLAAQESPAATPPPDGATPPPPPAEGGQRMAELFKTYDKDGDGELSPAEREALRADIEASVKKYDADGDGKLSPAELEKLAADHPMLAKMLARQGERKGREGPGGGEGGFAGREGRGPMLPPELLKAYDKDGDGELNPAEREALRDDVQNALKKYDADGNGTLSPEELEKLKADYPALAPLIERFNQRRAQMGERPGKERKGKKAPDGADAPEPEKAPAP